jgi:hypothetical protein
VHGLLISNFFIGATMNTLNTDKIVGLIGLLIAVLVGIGVAIPFAPLLLLVCGLVFGYYTPSEFQVRLIVSAIALTTFASALVAIPEVGSYLAAIVGNIAKTAQGAALLIILHNLSKRLTPVTQS